MATRLLYQKLVEIQLWHDFYFQAGSNPTPDALPYEADFDWRDHLELVPDTPTDLLLRKYRLLFRTTQHGGAVYAQAYRQGNEVHSLIPLDASMKFTFFIRLKAAGFVNYTNLSLVNAGSKIYYFNNLHDNEAEALFLSQQIAAYDPGGQVYRLGDLIHYDDGEGEGIFEAWDNFTSAANMAPDEDPLLWGDKSPMSQYVSLQDRLPLQSPLFTYSEATYPDFDTRVDFELRDVFDQSIDLDALIKGTQSWARTPAAPVLPGEEAAFRHQLNLAGLANGRYRLFVRGLLAQEFYLLNPLAEPRVFSVIEIFHERPYALIPPNYRFVDNSPDGDGKAQSILNEQTYVIRFKNRSTRWRYYFPSDPEASDVSNSRFEKEANGIYVTRRPLGLNRYLTGISLDEPPSIALPDPRPETILPTRDTSSSEEMIQDIFSEVYMSVNP